MPILTPKQRLFVVEYLKDLNATQAAIRAGYSEKTARSQGQRLLTNVDIAAAIKKAIDERAEKIQIDAEWVLRQAVALHHHCVNRPVLRDGEHVKDKEGNPLYRVNVAGAARALELIGKHVGVQAFQEKAIVDVNHNYAHLTLDEINAKIAERLERAAQKPVVGTKH